VVTKLPLGKCSIDIHTLNWKACSQKRIELLEAVGLPHLGVCIDNFEHQYAMITRDSRMVFEVDGKPVNEELVARLAACTVR
jgi:hypothetical protein